MSDRTTKAPRLGDDLGAALPPAGATAVLRDLSSGLISALITIAYCISFAALLFQGELQSGLSLGLAALLGGGTR